MPEQLYSVRMRASRSGRHISGAERICCLEEVASISATLTRRALTHPNGCPDNVQVTTELLEKVQRIPALSVQELTAITPAQARSQMRKLFDANGWCLSALDLVHQVKGLRGAMLVDAFSGTRLEPDQARGVRASHMDAIGGGTGRTKQHAIEALVLASKVAAAPGIVGEVCISDDPSYTTGYLATGGVYYRIPQCKAPGSDVGTRVFLFDPRLANLDDCLTFLEQTPVLVEVPDC
ncbi:6-carboxyhexanoate--CoA ligase [Staphylococcus chromogenes]|nr:6-carboxyhexanoate--CoA ligase [Staphylococcus chromogenes]